jgi:hypothetical protein
MRKTASRWRRSSSKRRRLDKVKGHVFMKKSLNLVLEDQDIIELMRILMDSDAEGSLEFLRKHFKGKARDLLEGG